MRQGARTRGSVTAEGWDGVGGGGRFQREGTSVCLWLSLTDVWQTPTQYYKAIILQLNINNFFLILKEKNTVRTENMNSMKIANLKLWVYILRTSFQTSKDCMAPKRPPSRTAAPAGCTQPQGPRPQLCLLTQAQQVPHSSCLYHKEMPTSRFLQKYTREEEEAKTEEKGRKTIRVISKILKTFQGQFFSFQ